MIKDHYIASSSIKIGDKIPFRITLIGADLESKKSVMRRSSSVSSYAKDAPSAAS